MSGVLTRAPARLRPRWSFELDDYPIAAAWSPRATQVAAAASSGPVALIDARSGEVVRISALAYQHAGPLLASGDGEGAVMVWDPVRSGEPLAQERFSGSVVTAGWDASDGAVLVATSEGTLAVLEL